MPVHGIDNGNNKHEVYTTEEVLSILQQAIDSGTLQGIDPDETPIVAAVRESHNNSDVTFWSGTEAEFNELTGVTSELVGARIGSDGKLYLLTGDTTLSDTVEAARQAALEATEGMKREVISVTLLANGWSNTAPYTQTVAVAGMTADKDFLAPYVVPTGNESDDIAAQVALSCISGGTTDTDSVTFYCYDEKPTTTITVFMVDKGTKIEPGGYPIASPTQIGMVKIGEGLNIDQAGEVSVKGFGTSGYFFDTVAAMKSYNLAAGDTAQTLGYRSINDGGAGTYRIISSEATADGGSLIELNNGLMAQLIVENDEVNVKQFGAYGDGSHDDSSYISAACAKFKNILIPEGTYKLNSTVSLSQNTNIYGKTAIVCWSGNTDNSKKTEIVTTDVYAFTCSWGKVNNFANLSFDGYGIDQPCGARINKCEFKGTLGIEHARASTISECSFHSCTTAGIKRLTDSCVQNCFFYSNEIAIDMDNSGDNRILGNKIEWNELGIKFKDTVYAVIANNIFDRQTTYGITIDNGSLFNNITGNLFERNLVNHIKGDIWHTTISSNKFLKKHRDDGDGTSPSLPTIAFDFSQFFHSTLTGNQIYADKVNVSNSLTVSNSSSVIGNLVNNKNSDFIYIKLGDVTIGANSSGTIEKTWSELKADILNFSNGAEFKLANIEARDGSNFCNFIGSNVITNIRYDQYWSIAVSLQNQSSASKTYSVYAKFDQINIFKIDFSS